MSPPGGHPAKLCVWRAPYARAALHKHAQAKMRSTAAVFVALTISLFAVDTLEAQRGGGGRGARANRWRRPAEITERIAVYFSETPGPATDGDKVSDLNTIDLVRAASAANQVTLLYLHDSEAPENVITTFENSLFRADQSGDSLAIKLRMFHRGQIDVSKVPALKERYGDDAPLFIAFNKDGKEQKAVSMKGYKAKARDLESLLDKASSGAFKPALKSFAKKYGKLILDIEKVLRAKTDAETERAKATSKSDQKKADKELAALKKAEEKLVEKEKKLLEPMRLPARGDKKVGGRNNRRGNTAGNTGKGNTGKGNTGG